MTYIFMSFIIDRNMSCLVYFLTVYKAGQPSVMGLNDVVLRLIYLLFNIQEIFLFTKMPLAKYFYFSNF